MSYPLRLVHPIEPVCGPDARVLILGSFPSVKSREAGFYYGHPQNRFWRVLGAVYGEEVPQTIPERKAFLLSHGIALWDVIRSCEITGSSDASIRNAQVNDLAGLLRQAPIRRILLNGKTAAALYRKYAAAGIGLPAVVLPSTSPANAAWNAERLTGAWRILREE